MFTQKQTNPYRQHPRSTGIVMAALFLLTSFMAGCGSSPIDVSITSEPNPYTDHPIPFAVISATADEVNIKNVTVNRGNCTVLGYTGSGHLVFGKELKAQLSCNANSVKEVEVETDTGSYTFSF